MTFFNIDFASYSKVIVIHGSSVNEQLFFAMINTLTDHPVYEWDISHCTNEGLIMDSGEVSREVLESVILDEVAEIVTQEKKKECKKLYCCPIKTFVLPQKFLSDSNNFLSHLITLKIPIAPKPPILPTPSHQKQRPGRLGRGAVAIP